MMPLRGHQAPICLGELWVDLSSRVGGEHERALDAIVTTRRDLLPGTLYTAAVSSSGKETAEAPQVALRSEPPGIVDDAGENGREALADAGDGAQDIVWLQLGIQPLDASLKSAEHLDLAQHQLDFHSDLHLQLDEVDVVAVQLASLSGGVSDSVDERVDEGAGVRLIATRVLGDEASEGTPTGAEHPIRIEPVLEYGQRKAGTQVGEHTLENGRGPPDEIHEPALAGGHLILKPTALLREPLQGVAFRRRHMNRVEPRAAEGGDGGEHVSVGEIGLGVLGKIPPQRLHPLALHAGDLDTGVAQAMGDGEPAHPCRLHDRLHGGAGMHVRRHGGDECIKRGRVVAEADRPSDGLSIFEDLGDMVATDRKVYSDGSMHLVQGSLV